MHTSTLSGTGCGGKTQHQGFDEQGGNSVQLCMLRVFFLYVAKPEYYEIGLTFHIKRLEYPRCRQASGLQTASADAALVASGTRRFFISRQSPWVVGDVCPPLDLQVGLGTRMSLQNNSPRTGFLW
jgi:hypothetical protein